ncbi:MAG: hypothetical protein A2Z16_16465 [Chloroflexi bacterium RBG_16_54_18]|nr:MAG: hypothetical protein A2Z16_16465 [Chloroflexi bacterium RBG_16_54_18]
MDLGERIRYFRIRKRITGAELAQKTSVSRSLISQIEKNNANPSIETLRRIANVLEVPIAALFEEQEPSNGMVVRKSQRKRLKLSQSNIFYELLTPDLNRQLELIWIEVEPGQQNVQAPSFGHIGEESAVVLYGQIHVYINNDVYVLNEGDSISFDSSKPHSIANLGTEKVVMVSAITPPSF